MADNKDIIEHIERHCEDIKNTIQRFGNDLDVFLRDDDYQRSICMSLLQIGELVGHLSDDFKKSNDQIPWKQIRGLRNIVAHAYGSVDFVDIFDTAQNDVAHLECFCRKCLEQYTLLKEEAITPDIEDDMDFEM